MSEAMKSQEKASESIPVGLKAEKKEENPPSIFALFSLGVATNRDSWAYNSSRAGLEALLARYIGKLFNREGKMGSLR